MPGSNFGRILQISTFGESHGKAIGVILGRPSARNRNKWKTMFKFSLTAAKPGQSEITTPRKESDKVSFLSGIFEGRTTGTPMAMILHNMDIRSSDYSDIADKYRPGHADFSY